MFTLSIPSHSYNSYYSLFLYLFNTERYDDARLLLRAYKGIWTV